MLRVLHVGYGALGRSLVADFESRGAGELAAVVDPDPTERDRPILSGLDQVEGWDRIDAALVTTQSELAACAETFRALIERGIAVVSTCEELSYPWLRSPRVAEELDRLARERGGRLLGTGFNPGFLMDAFPAYAATVCREVRSVRVERVQDASLRRKPFRDKVGAGLSLEEFERRASAGNFGHAGLGESLHLLASCLGVEIERWDESLDPVEGEDGGAAGVLQVARGYAGGRPVVELCFHAALGAADPRDRVVIEGDPPIELLWRGGVPGDVATSAVVLSCLPRLLAAPPGLHTMASLPISAP